MDYPIARPVAQLYRPASTLRIRPHSAGNYIQQCNCVYAEAHGTGLVMDVFSPEGSGNGVGIIDVIGSGWYSDRVVLNEHIGLGLYDVLCGRGYTVFALSPGSITVYDGLAMVRHVRAGIRHIKARAESFGIAPQRLGMTGASAGAHIAALAALLAKPVHPASRDPFRQWDTHVSAVGLFFPPTDLLDYAGKRFDAYRIEEEGFDRLFFAGGIAGRTADEVNQRALELSPARHVKANPPPFLLFHGDADEVVPLEQSRKLVDALRAAGGEAELVVKPGGGHPWPDIRQEIETLADWFDGRLRTGLHRS